MLGNGYPSFKGSLRLDFSSFSRKLVAALTPVDFEFIPVIDSCN